MGSPVARPWAPAVLRRHRQCPGPQPASAVTPGASFSQPRACVWWARPLQLWGCPLSWKTPPSTGPSRMLTVPAPPCHPGLSPSPFLPASECRLYPGCISEVLPQYVHELITHGQANGGVVQGRANGLSPGGPGMHTGLPQAGYVLRAGRRSTAGTAGPLGPRVCLNALCPWAAWPLAPGCRSPAGRVPLTGLGEVPQAPGGHLPAPKRRWGLGAQP